MRYLKSLLQSIFCAFGFVLLSRETHTRLVKNAEFARVFAILTRLGSSANVEDFKKHIPLSKSQLQQDLASLTVAGFKRDGFFVEFGATDGVTLSNTYLLEKNFGWTGILAEPSQEWHSRLRQNRSAEISTDAVWSQTGLTLQFLENAEFSTLVEFKNSDRHTRRGRTYDVSTISLNDLLALHAAPEYIDFMSVDTEGSELEVLQELDFSSYKFGFICVEHNFTEARSKIHDLLSNNGYRRVLEDVSEWDDWFVPAN